MKTFSIFEALSFGWNVAKSHFTFFIPVLLIALVIPTLLHSFSGAYTKDINLAFSSIVNLIGALLTLYFSIGLIRISVKLASGQEAVLGDLYKNISLGLYLRFFVTSVLAAFGIFVGFLFLIIPGIYLSLRWSLLQYAIVDRNSGIVEAFNLSSQWTKGNKIRLLGLALLNGLISLVGILALLIGLFWAIPTVIVAQAYVYKKLSSQQ